jgi:hypothetical protein
VKFLITENAYFKRGSRVARFFLMPCTKTGENVPNDRKISKFPLDIPSGNNITKMAIKYTNILIPRPPKYTQKGFLVWNYIIWQPYPAELGQ